MKIKYLLLVAVCWSLCEPCESFGDSLDIREWLVPYEDSAPSDPFVDPRGRIWFIGRDGNYAGNLTPASNQFNRYDLPNGSGARSLAVDSDGNIWFSASADRYIGKLSPSTGQVDRFAMPGRKARDPHSMAFDTDGNIWFTVPNGNFIGMLNTTSGDVELIEVPTRNAEPFGIVVDPDNRPWASASGSNKLFEIDSSTFSLREIELPDADSRPRRLVATSDGDIWFADYSRGRLGHYAVLNGQITQWLMPGGEDSKPYGMAVDRDDRIWIVETGNVPNRFVGFDTGSGVFLNETDIPSGGGTVSHMYYHEPAGEVWFATATNYIGRAKVH